LKYFTYHSVPVLAPNYNRLVQSGKTASGGCSAGQGSSEPVAPRIYLFNYYILSPENAREVCYSLVELHIKMFI
jgi:hypothetical protein